MEEVHELIEKDKKISLLEKQEDELEQYTKMDDLIVCGLNTRHSYPRITVGVRGTPLH